MASDPPKLLLGIENLRGVGIVEPVNVGAVLTYDGSVWKNEAGGGGSTTYAGLTDVDITGRTDGSFTYFDNGSGNYKPTSAIQPSGPTVAVVDGSGGYTLTPPSTGVNDVLVSDTSVSNMSNKTLGANTIYRNGDNTQPVSMPATTSADKFILGGLDQSISSTKTYSAGQIFQTDAEASILVGADKGAATITNDTDKAGVILSRHVKTLEEDVNLISYNNSFGSGKNIISIGGGSGLYNASTDVKIYTASNNITLGGSVSGTFNTYGLGLGNNLALPSVSLNLASTTQAVGLPSMTGAERDLITTPPTGSMVYNSDTDEINTYNGSVWAGSGGSGFSWVQSGFVKNGFNMGAVEFIPSKDVSPSDMNTFVVPQNCTLVKFGFSIAYNVDWSISAGDVTISIGTVAGAHIAANWTQVGADLTILNNASGTNPVVNVTTNIAFNAGDLIAVRIENSGTLASTSNAADGIVMLTFVG